MFWDCSKNCLLACLFAWLFALSILERGGGLEAISTIFGLIANVSGAYVGFALGMARSLDHG